MFKKSTMKEELSEVNEKIRKIKEAERVRAYCEKHPDKRKEARAKWDKKNRREYQRKYRELKKLGRTKDEA